MAKELKSAANMLMSTGAPKHTVEAPTNDYYNNNVEYKTERTQILLRKSTKKALKKIAKEQTAGSLNELINRICEEYIKEHGEA